MYNNPAYRNEKQQSPRLRVTLVTRTGEIAQAEDVAQFCKDKNVVFVARQYDAQEYAEDQDEIERLPAFHMYEINSNAYLGTFYPTEDPIDYIQQQLERVKAREAVAKVRREVWERRMGFLAGLFKLPTVPLPRFRKSRSLSSLSTYTG